MKGLKDREGHRAATHQTHADLDLLLNLKRARLCISRVFLDVIPNLRPEFAAIWLHIFYLHFRPFAKL